MCGIAGWFTVSDKQHNESELIAMSNAIAHRGPDGKGYWSSEHVALAHRRLAIIGLDSGVQPMLSGCSQVCISFNGEIYNYKALKRELQGDGLFFNSDSDTEVIINLYLHNGSESFGRLRGMFAFSLWDSRTKTGYLVRDQNGIKPLFYQNDSNKSLVFGSEAKAIVAKRGGNSSLNHVAMHNLLNFRYIPDESTLFTNIDQLPPGGVLTWQNGNISTSQLVDFDLSTDDGNILDVVCDSTTIHMVSDVEVGAYLSGGIDSALISAIAKKSLKNIKTFTLNVGDDPSEALNAKETANELELDNYMGEVAGEIEGDLQKMIWHLEVPKINALQVYQLSRHASNYVKVVLSGLGADELFLGYNAHSIVAKADWLRKHFSPLVVGSGKIAGKLSSRFGKKFWSEFERSMLMAEKINNPSMVYGLLRNVWDSQAAREKIYGPRMLDCKLPSSFEWLSENWQEDSTDSVLAMRGFEWRRKMVNDLLWQEDRCSMAHGLEVRVPFVDQFVKNRVWGLTREELMKNGEKKGLLKEVARSFLSDRVLNRKKSGFQVDAPRFFNARLGKLAKIYLSPEVIKRKAMFNPEFVKHTLNMAPHKANRWHYFMLYLMIGTHIWLDIFEEGQSV